MLCRCGCGQKIPERYTYKEYISGHKKNLIEECGLVCIEKGCSNKVSEIGRCCKKCAQIRVWDERGRGRRKYRCIDCNKEISCGPKRCWECYTIYPRGPTPEHVRQKISLALTGTKDSDEIKRKKSEGVKASITEERRQEMSEVAKENHKQGVYGEEWRKKCSIGQKKSWESGERKVGYPDSPTTPEKDIMKVLTEFEIDYKFQFPLGSYRYDFYLPNYNLLIEYDGWFWHTSEWATGNGALERDAFKDKLAREAGLGLLRLKPQGSFDFTYDEIYILLKKELNVPCHP